MIKEYLEKNKEEFKRWLVDGEQGRVDLKILPYLQDIEKGFFVEAGALDGLFMSNTKILEELGWSGLLIEPSKRAVLECKKNRKVPVEECALVSFEYDKADVLGDFLFDGEGGAGAWSSITRKVYGQRSGTTFTPMGTYVRARTLESVLKQHGVTKIDFFSLDVEGYEREVLKGINLKELEITYLLIEIKSTLWKK